MPLRAASAPFEVWNLELLWSLVLGAWCFISKSTSASQFRCRENHPPCLLPAPDNQRPGSYSRGKYLCNSASGEELARRSSNSAGEKSADRSRRPVRPRKLQAPSSKHQRSTKHQASKCRCEQRALPLKFGIWSFPGAWSLELGAFPFASINTSASGSQFRCRENHPPCLLPGRDNRKRGSYWRGKYPCNRRRGSGNRRRP
jgi:hypothetical protein